MNTSIQIYEGSNLGTQLRSDPTTTPGHVTDDDDDDFEIFDTPALIFNAITSVSP